MDGFMQRKIAFEAKYHHDEEMMFRVISRRNYLFGLWVAELLGYLPQDTEAYAQSIMNTYLSHHGDPDLLLKAHHDFEKGHVDLSQHRLEKALLSCHVHAQDDIAREEGMII